ncbi:hypothetical protein LguiA_032058 [Lonicera macranthoides]
MIVNDTLYLDCVLKSTTDRKFLSRAEQDVEEEEDEEVEEKAPKDEAEIQVVAFPLDQHMLIEMQLLQDIDPLYESYAFFCSIDENIALLVDPGSPQFNTHRLTESLFKGTSGLCGYPLNVSCNYDVRVRIGILPTTAVGFVVGLGIRAG